MTRILFYLSLAAMIGAGFIPTASTATPSVPLTITRQSGIAIPAKLLGPQQELATTYVSFDLRWKTAASPQTGDRYQVMVNGKIVASYTTRRASGVGAPCGIPVSIGIRLFRGGVAGPATVQRLIPGCRLGK